MPDPTVWKIYSRLPAHFDPPEDYASECFSRDIIAIGWNQLGDVSRAKSKEAIRSLAQKVYKKSAREAGQIAGSIWSFYHNLKVGHFVLCPDKNSNKTYLGEVVGPASYDPDGADAACPFVNRRKIRWSPPISQDKIDRLLGDHYGGNQTVTRVQASKSAIASLLKGQRRGVRTGTPIPMRPDQEWGRQAEERAMEWLREKKRIPVDVSSQNKGWDIEADNDLYEVKGRKSPATRIRLTENEWRAAVRHGKRYTLLIFTASTIEKLRTSQPKKQPDPSRTESWSARERVIVEYFLDQ